MAYPLPHENGCSYGCPNPKAQAQSQAQRAHKTHTHTHTYRPHLNDGFRVDSDRTDGHIREVPVVFDSLIHIAPVINPTPVVFDPSSDSSADAKARQTEARTKSSKRFEDTESDGVR